MTGYQYTTKYSNKILNTTFLYFYVRFGISEICQIWRKRWIFIKDSFFGYFQPETSEIRCILLMDQEFQVRSGYSETGLKCGLVVSNSSRQLVMKSLTKRETKEWVDCIQHVMGTTGTLLIILHR